MMDWLKVILAGGGPPVRGVIHVGASGGGEYHLYKAYSVAAQVYVEPQPEPYGRLVSRVKGIPGIRTFRAACGNVTGTARMNLLKGNESCSSSLLRAKKHLEYHPEYPPDGVIEVPLVRLDDLLRENAVDVSAHNLLVVDVQGYELEALKGGRETLRSMDYVVPEVNREELYESCALVDELDAWMRKAGFRRTETVWDGPNGSYGDALYVRSLPEPISSASVKPGSRPLRILTHNIHTGYDAELAKTGHEFFVLDTFKPWDPEVRTRPVNWRHVDDPAGMEFDAILVSHVWDFAERFGKLDAPMIFSVIADCSEGVFPRAIEERCSAVSFLAGEVAARWELREPRKKRVLEMGIDPAPFLERVGDHAGVLTVGHRIGKRWDKGHCPYVTVSQFIPLTIVGPGNEDLPGAAGTVTHGRLMEMYSRYRVYFNPGPIIGISVAEAMMAGMPVVAFRPINLCGLIEDGVNGYVVDTVDGAILRIKRLLDDPELASKMGRAAGVSARERFDSSRFVARWDALFREVAV